VTPLLAAGDGHIGLAHVGLFALVLVVPRVLQRWRMPAAITSFLFGAILGPIWSMFEEQPLIPAGDENVALLGTLGIVALFLLAGLEVDLHALRREARGIATHLGLSLVLIAAVGGGALWAFDLDAPAAALAALALLTPSGGFILDSLPALGLYPDEQLQVRNRVIAAEVFSLGLLLVVRQSNDWQNLAIALGGGTAMCLGMPLIRRAITAAGTPHAPKSEFAFLVLLAVICAVATRELGVYYLVGAFVVGLTARRYRERVPAMSSDRILHAVEALSSLFAPFYFFHAGVTLREDDLSLAALGTGFLFLVVVGALRIWVMVEHNRWGTRAGAATALRTALPLAPTLVFTLVLSSILRDEFQAPEYLVGGLIVYAVLNTLLPSLLFKSLPVSDYGTPSLPQWEESETA